MKKRLTALFLAFALVFALLPAAVLTASAETYSGTCGENLTWTLDTETGVLTISGEGKMDWEIIDDIPWLPYKSDIKEVVIGDGVTNIGFAAFWGYPVASVSLPNSITNIEGFAFTGCSELANITLPANLEKIGDTAFSYCSGLSSIAIPSSVKEIGRSAFEGCTGLNAVYITDLSAWCAIDFHYDYDSTAANPLQIARHLYLNDTLITDLVIPDDVTSIGDYLFCGADFSSVTIGNGVTQIGIGSFNFCDELISVTIGSGLTSIGEGAFFLCSELADVYYFGTASDWNTISIGPNNFSLLMANIHFESTGPGTFFEGTYGENLTWTLDTETGVLEITGTGEMNDWDYSVPWYSRRYSIKSVSIGDGVTSIGWLVFQDCTGLVNVTIPDSVTSIGSLAFFDCTGLTSVTIPDSVTSIGDYAFGYRFNYDTYEYEKIDGFTIYGEKDSAAQVYAEENGFIFVDLEDVPCQHEHAHPEHKDATCTEAGYDRMICDDCGEVISETVLPALGHDLVVDPAVPATCTATGLTEGQHCTRCDYKVAQEVVPMTAHNYKDGVCTVCGAKDPDYMPPVTGNPFKDVKSGEFYYDAVLWAVNAQLQVTSGTSATTFSPNDTCTRAQVVTFLWRAKGCPEPKSNNNPFTDVKESEYYYKAVLWAVENEITAGTSATTFSPNAGCTRAQVVTFLWRTEGQPKPASSNNPFKDVKGGYYYDAVLWAVEKNITAGTSATTFSPDNTCTRGQIVTFLYRDLA